MLPLLVSLSLFTWRSFAVTPTPANTSPTGSTAIPVAPLTHTGPEMVPLDAFQAAGNPVVKDFELPLMQGGTFKLSDQKGKTVVLSFWASWCGPCRKELPALSTFAATHPDVKFIAVNVDRERSAADKFLGAVSITLPVAFDPDAKALGSYGVTAMPTIFVIDKKGALAFSHTGYSEEKGFAELEAALGTAK